VAGTILALLAGGVPLAANDAPRPFVADASARPIETADSSTPLRWRATTAVSPSQPIALTSGQGDSSADAGLAGQPHNSADGRAAPATGRGFDSPATGRGFESRGGWNITRIAPSVRPAQAVSDPFRDPFGDSQAGYTEELVLQPTGAEANIEELPPPRTINAPRLSSPENHIRVARQPAPLLPDPMLDAERFGDPRGTPCDRIYNDRNCCDVELACREFRNRLIADSIRNISLDITPRYSPDLTVEEDAAMRADRLRLLESRAWRDKQGRVVATGRMANLANDAVVVVDEAGREVARVPLQQLGEDEVCFVTAWWRLPAECSLGEPALVRREWIPSTFAWHASALCHKPLYFEQPQLERYGHTTGPFTQPVISGAHFFLNIATLPYQMAINPPHECQYALGYYRPGSCAPKMIRPIPLSARGAAAQTGAVLGGVFLIP
jgi:hypothetical protein